MCRGTTPIGELCFGQTFKDLTFQFQPVCICFKIRALKYRPKRQKKFKKVDFEKKKVGEKFLQKNNEEVTRVLRLFVNLPFCQMTQSRKEPIRLGPKSWNPY